MRNVTVRLERDAGAPRRARRALEEAVGDRADASLDTARLLLSELVTNSVRHAAGRIEVEVEVSGATLTVRVRDDGPGPPAEEAHRMPPPDAAGGRGLPLVAALAERWGIRRGAMAEVWFSLALMA